jgi:hypothetical protein
MDCLYGVSQILAAAPSKLTLIEDMVQTGRRIIAGSTRVIDPALSSEMQGWPGSMELHVCADFQTNIVVDPCTIYT